MSRCRGDGDGINGDNDETTIMMRMVPRWSKMAPKLPKMAQDVPKMAQHGSKMARDNPRWPQDGPKMCPRWSPRARKMA